MTHKLHRIPTLISTQDLAARLGVSTKTISRLISSGKLPAIRLGRQIRITEEDAVRLIASGRF